MKAALSRKTCTDIAIWNKGQTLEARGFWQRLYLYSTTNNSFLHTCMYTDACTRLNILQHLPCPCRIVYLPSQPMKLFFASGQAIPLTTVLTAELLATRRAPRAAMVVPEVRKTALARASPAGFSLAIRFACFFKNPYRTQ
mmetsp:Transcript_21310/g.48110  ORF Transcript_21310/g.48110 Transcript_21310/m.48110 type:complete len:141 (-) Transcript_21310:208-630(-)